MTSLIPVLSLLLVIVVSLLVVRVATVALVLTGLSQHLARFQARSAFTGAGFTTTESEKVMRHPVRRKVIMTLMLLGNAGIVTAVTSLLLSLVDTGGEGVGSSLWVRFVVLTIGIAILWRVAHSQWVDRKISRFIAWALRRWTSLEVRDYSGLLHLADGYAVVELQVEPGDWLAEQQLAKLQLSEEGVLVLGVEREDGGYVGAPRGQTQLHTGDTVLLYGPTDIINNIDERRTGSEGNWEHHRAVDKQHKAELEEQNEQPAPR